MTKVFDVIAMIISIRLIMEVDNKYIPMVYLEECLYETI